MSKKQDKPVALRYVGNGAYLPFVPARDLSADEAAQHWQIIKTAEANKQRLYVPVEQVEKQQEE